VSDVRVLHAISEMTTGGAETHVVEMVQRGPTVGWRSAVASHGGQRVADLRSAGVPHFDVALPRRTLKGLFAARRAVARAVADFQPDIVIAHNVSASLVARLARPKAPILTVFHGVTAAEYRYAANILSFVSDRVVAVSDATGTRLCSAGLHGVDVTIIRNAVTPRVGESRRRAREALNIPEDAAVVLCIARMEPPKRHDSILDAWARLSGTELLLFAGDGSLRPTLERRASCFGDRVRFLGDRKDIPTLLAAADMTVLPSDDEGLPIAVLESLAAGCPVVASDVGGLREVLAPGGGKLVPPGNVDALAAAVREMLQDHVARDAAADIGLSTIARFHDPEQMMRRYDRLVREMLVEGRR
jgi:glycosyltransferase involved in cell wall biosynthesis